MPFEGEGKTEVLARGPLVFPQELWVDQSQCPGPGVGAQICCVVPPWFQGDTVHALAQLWLGCGALWWPTALRFVPLLGSETFSGLCGSLFL